MGNAVKNRRYKTLNRDTKLKLIKEHLEDGVTQETICQREDVRVGTFQKWISDFRHKGERAFTRTYYSMSTKLSAVRMAKEIGLVNAAKELAIPVPTLNNWMRKTQGACDKVVCGDNEGERPMPRSPQFKEYPNALRLEAVLDAIAPGASKRQVAKQHGVPENTLYRWVARYRKMGPSAFGASEVDGAETVETGRGCAAYITVKLDDGRLIFLPPALFVSERAASDWVKSLRTVHGAPFSEARAQVVEDLEHWAA